MQKCTYSPKMPVSNDTQKIETKDNLLQKSQTSQTQGFESRCQSSKLFQRKPSFKIFSKKQIKGNPHNDRICYISPQKSDLFKKYSNFGQNISNLDESYFINKSSSNSCFHPTTKSIKPNSLLIDSDQSKSIFKQINNTVVQDGLRALKDYSKTNAFNNNKKSSDSNLKIKNFQPDQTQDDTTFDKDFNSLIKFNDLYSPIGSKSFKNYFRPQDRKSKVVLQNKKQCLNRNQHQQNRDLKNKIFELQLSNDSFRSTISKMQNDKLHIEQSSRLFLEQIKNLSTNIQYIELQRQKQQKQRQKQQRLTQKLQETINELQIDMMRRLNQIKDQQRIIQMLNIQKISLEQQIKLFGADQNNNKSRYEINQAYKYMQLYIIVLKKKLQQKTETQCRHDRMQIVNRKLTAKNKYLLQQIKFLQKQNSQCTQQTPKKKLYPEQNTKLNFNRKNPQKRMSLNKQQTHQSQSNEFAKRLTYKNSFHSNNISAEMDQKFSALSNDSSSQLSFQLSPQKKDSYERFKFNSLCQ